MNDAHRVSNIEQTTNIPIVNLIEYQLSGANLSAVFEPFADVLRIQLRNSAAATRTEVQLTRLKGHLGIRSKCPPSMMV